MQLRTVFVIGLVSLSLLFPFVLDGMVAPPWRCGRKPVEPCFKHHGRLSSQNGVALKVWLIGTKRIVGLDNDIAELPPEVRKYMEMTSSDHSYVYGDFEICPLEKDTPGHMRSVCVAGAEKLVVQDVQS